MSPSTARPMGGPGRVQWRAQGRGWAGGALVRALCERSRRDGGQSTGKREAGERRSSRARPSKAAAASTSATPTATKSRCGRKHKSADLRAHGAVENPRDFSGGNRTLQRHGPHPKTISLRSTAYRPPHKGGAGATGPCKACLDRDPARRADIRGRFEHGWRTRKSQSPRSTARPQARPRAASPDCAGHRRHHRGAGIFVLTGHAAMPSLCRKLRRRDLLRHRGHWAVCFARPVLRRIRRP